MSKKISILGVGWLGLPLANALQNQGYNVKGSVTSSAKAEALRESGIDVSVVELDNGKAVVEKSDFFDADVLVINIPPRRVPDIENIYPAQIRQILPYVSKYKKEKIIFISSTSVYPEVNRTVTEKDAVNPDKASGVACLNAEKILQEAEGLSSTVIRFGGLIGADRNPHRFMKRGVKNGAGLKPVNLIHLEDCIGIIKHIIENDIWNEVINGCSPEHPTRDAFYRRAAEVAGVTPPIFDREAPFDFKRVSSKKLVEQLGYHFRYQNPVDFL